MNATAPAAVPRCYGVHGLTLAVSSTEAAVHAAVEHRLRDFALDEKPFGPSLEITYGPPGSVRDDAEPADGRPVYETRHGTLFYRPDDDLLHGRFGGVELTCRASAGTADLRAAALSESDLYIATHPLLTISLMELGERRGRFALHAAALADAAGRGLLLAGPSGSGKSTLALALARSGLGFLSDDTIFLSGEDGHVLGFADTVGVTPFSAQVFPELAELLAAPPADGFPKRLSRIEDLFGRPPVSACTPAVLLFPEVAGVPETTTERISPGEALLRLTPDVLLTDPRSSQAHLAAIGRLLGAVDCYAVRTGTDLDRAVEVARRTLS